MVGNRYMSFEGIVLKHFSDTYQEKSSSYLHILKRHAVFHFFLSDNRNQDAATTAAHSKRIIWLLKA